jgi:hypothetical protein|tara:strand:- start:444 stop:734 length:291 start_codon:yes stop_codon:yes gene_type:complete
MSIVAEHWWLKQRPSPTIRIDSTTNEEYADYMQYRENILAVGTQEQLDVYLGQRVKKDGWELKDAWEFPLNDEMIEMYNNNNKEIIILNLERWQKI